MATLLDIGAGKVVNVATFYKVSELLGVGRYSEVYRAFDTNSQTDVALKLYSGFDQASHDMAKAEEGTLATIGKLNSEYFPKLRRTARHRIQNRNHPLLVLELGSYVGPDGQKKVVSLKDVLPQAEGPFSPRPDSEFWTTGSLARWIIHLVQAVKQLHDLGIVHRDLKPANILLKRGVGQSGCLPMFLDFNSAASGEATSGTGTPKYLPPEVTTGKRLAAAQTDDLWAVAMVGWELIHGAGSSPDDNYNVHDNIAKDFPNSIVDVLRQALSLNPTSRFQNATELLSALESAFRTDAARSPELTVDEVAQARASMQRIRMAMWQTLAPPGEIFVPKETEDAVTTVIAWLSQEDTQSLNLVSEIARLGPLAIPVCLQQGYRVSPAKPAYQEIVKAVVQLAAEDPIVATRSINRYALSSNLGVRSLCWAVCEQLRYFPEVMLDSLNEDEGLLLPKERIKIADLCIRFSTKRSAVLALVKYMCREYILDRARFRDLCVTVARRMHELQLRDESVGTDNSGQQSTKVRQLITPLLIAQDTGQCIWEELPEFEELTEQTKIETEKGLVELMAEAFAATGEAGLEILKTGKVPATSGSANLPVYRRFAAKLAASNPDTLAWLKTRPAWDRESRRALEAVSRNAEEAKQSPVKLLADYLKSDDIHAYNALRFSKNAVVLSLIDKQLQDSPSRSVRQRLLKLLKGFESRQRQAVVKVALDHWEELSSIDYKSAVQVLTLFEVPPHLKKRATTVLNSELSGPHAVEARRGLEQMLR